MAQLYSKHKAENRRIRWPLKQELGGSDQEGWEEKLGDKQPMCVEFLSLGSLGFHLCLNLKVRIDVSSDRHSFLLEVKFLGVSPQVVQQQQRALSESSADLGLRVSLPTADSSCASTACFIIKPNI